MDFIFAIRKKPDRILIYGFPDYNHQKAIELVGKKWNIEPYQVAGCIVSDKLIDSIKTVHIKLWKKKDSIYGLDSEKKFRNELIAEKRE